ncbi:hypothetical protein P7C70_g1997, partial [Phenoliferia sp. Uapishka_3]
MSPITLSYLTLFPIPLESLPPVGDADFNATLLGEADRLLASPLWTDTKAWYSGIVTTCMLPLDATTHVPGSLHGSAPIEGVVAADPASVKKSGSRFWGGGHKSAKKPDEGIAWHMRTSRLTADWKDIHHGMGYEQFHKALAEKHCAQEVRLFLAEETKSDAGSI